MPADAGFYFSVLMSKWHFSWQISDSAIKVSWQIIDLAIKDVFIKFSKFAL